MIQIYYFLLLMFYNFLSSYYDRRKGAPKFEKQHDPLKATLQHWNHLCVSEYGMDVELAERELERSWLLVAKRKLERRPTWKAEREHGKEDVEEEAEEEKRMTKDGRTTSFIDVAAAKSFK